MIANKDEYKKAILIARDNKVFFENKLLDMLRAQYNSDNHTITATSLAHDIGYKDFSASNLLYGGLGHKIADILGYTPPKRKDGTPRWYWTLSTTSDSQDDDDGHYEFTMRPELVTALEEMKWVKVKPTS